VSRKPGWGVLVLAGAAVGVFGLFVYGYLTKLGWMGVADKTLWDWMQLLIVPFMLAGGGYLLNSRYQQYNDEMEAMAQDQREAHVGMERAQEEALRAFLDLMNRLIIEGNLFEQPEDSKVSRFAQVSTLQTLLGLDSDRKRRPLTLLYDLDLISKHNPIISLKNAALDTADLSEITLHDACLREADLRRARLSGADLAGSDLREVDFRGAFLGDADLSDACLAGANLLPYDEKEPAKLSTTNLLSGVADPNYVDVSEDYLVPTYLRGANLRNADLTGAYLTGTEVTTEQLAACKSLEGATMPDGQKYEDWLKDKESRKQNE
jgi:uncharacterized protein YjbI with pentapeptide repeats